MALDLTFYLALVMLGAVAGVLAGMLGIGGGVLIVPALVLLLELWHAPVATLTHTAVATSLATIVFTSASAARAQLRRGAVEWTVVRNWLPWLVVGSLIAGFVAEMLPLAAFRALIAVFLLTVATIMLRAWTPDPHRRLPGSLGSVVIGSGTGLVAGLVGIGGGNILVPTLVYFNIAMHRAAATASTLGVPIALCAATSFVVAGWDAPGRLPWSAGYVHLPGVAAIAVLSTLTAPLGVALAHRLPAATLKRVFGLLLLVVALRMLAGLVMM